jgi:hypothetical protein
MHKIRSDIKGHRALAVITVIAFHYNPAQALEDARLLLSHSEVKKGHRRITTRHYHQSDRVDWFEEKSQWEGLRSMGMVQPNTERNGKTTEKERHYLCSIGLDVKLFAKSVRGH